MKSFIPVFLLFLCASCRAQYTTNAPGLVSGRGTYTTNIPVIIAGGNNNETNAPMVIMNRVGPLLAYTNANLPNCIQISGSSSFGGTFKRGTNYTGIVDNVHNLSVTNAVAWYNTNSFFVPFIYIGPVYSADTGNIIITNGFGFNQSYGGFLPQADINYGTNIPAAWQSCYSEETHPVNAYYFVPLNNN